MTPEDHAPLTSERVEKAIQFYIRKLSEATDAYAEASDDKADAKSNLEIKQAQARTHFRTEVTRDWEKKPTEQQVEDYCTLQTTEELRRKHKSEAVEESTRIAVRSLQSRLDATRSLGASVRGNLD